MCTDLWIIISNLLVGAGTIFLAVVAFRSIRESRRIREEDKLHDIRRFALDKVYSWVKRISDLGFEMHTPRNTHEIYDLIQELASLRFQLFEIKQYANVFEEYFGNLFNSTEEALQKYTDTLGDKLDEIRSLPKPEQETIFLDGSLTDFFVTGPRAINVLSNALLKSIADLRIQLKL